MESARAQSDLLTPSQRQAVTARGNVLVMAGAGTGKTHTLVERCLDCLCRERASLDEILVVTFTEAAATEMKQRLRTALEANSRLSTLSPRPTPGRTTRAVRHRAHRHAAQLLPRLVREHFYELGLDPQLAVLDAGEARLLAEETLDEQFQSHYAGQTDLSVAAQNLIQIYGNGDDRPIRAMLLRLHHYAQTRPDADRWLAEQIARFASPEPVEWREWLHQAIRDWRDEWLPVLENLGDAGLRPGSESAATRTPRRSSALRRQTKRPARASRAIQSGVAGTTFSRETAAEVLEKILAADENYPKGKKGALRKPLENFFADAAFLHSLMPMARQPRAAGRGLGLDSRPHDRAAATGAGIRRKIRRTQTRRWRAGFP